MNAHQTSSLAQGFAVVFEIIQRIERHPMLLQETMRPRIASRTRVLKQPPKLALAENAVPGSIREQSFQRTWRGISCPQCSCKCWAISSGESRLPFVGNIIQFTAGHFGGGAESRRRAIVRGAIMCKLAT